MDLVSSRWTAEPAFVSGNPTEVLMGFAAERLAQSEGPPRLLDLGCGAARSAVPLAELGFRVDGVDLSEPMISAAIQVPAQPSAADRVALHSGPMAPLPFEDGTFDVVVARGIWNLSTTDATL